MRNLRSFLLLGSVLALGAGPRGFADAPAAPAGRPTDVHSELLHLLETDAKIGPSRPAVSAAPKADSAPTPVVHPSPTATLGRPFSSELWAYFTDTGILAANHGQKVTKELTFGPCTDGELLNQRFYW